MQAQLSSDLSLFRTLSSEAHRQDFCRSAFSLLEDGASGARKKIQAASKGLGASFDEVESTIAALAMFMLQVTKNKLNQARIKGFVNQLDLPVEASATICNFIAEHSEPLVAIIEAKDVLKRAKGSSSSSCSAGERIADLQGLKWRFDVQVASRRKHEEMLPNVTLNFETDQGVKQCSCDYAALRRLRDELTAAKQALDSVHAQRILRYIR